MKRLIILTLTLLFTNCAYDFQKEAKYTWQIMQERIPDCRDREIPKIFIDSGLPLMGVYIEKHNLIILKYEYADVLHFELLRACGVITVEHYCPIAISGDWRKR
jgi:hypothetical protein